MITFAICASATLRLLVAAHLIYTQPMVRLTRFLLLSMLICTCGVVLTRWVGTRTLPALAAIFTTPDGLPCAQLCLFGVQPGLTTTPDAITLLTTHPLIRDFDVVSHQPFRLEGHADRIMMVSFNAAANGTVDEITVATYLRYGSKTGEVQHHLPDAVLLGDVLSTFGTPDFIQITNGGDPILSFVDKGVLASLIRTRTVNRHIMPRTPLSRLTLFRYQPCPDSAFIYVFPEWHGLAGFGYYARVNAIDTMVRRMDSQGATFAPCHFS
jgi:hypothetical protein